jgi:K+-sensing histidine kinase KdpD
MRIVKVTFSIVLSLAVVSAVTAVLWYVKVAGNGPLHPIFFYLLPIVLVAILCGSVPAMVCAGAAVLCAAFFLYDPIYSLYVSNPLEGGELVCFAALALTGVKCFAELLRPVVRLPVKSRYGRL